MENTSGNFGRNLNSVNSNQNNMNQLDVEETRETLEILYEISQILNCGVNRDSLSVLVSMIENGANPEALTAVVKEMKKENFAIGNNK